MARLFKFLPVVLIAAMLPNAAASLTTGELVRACEARQRLCYLTIAAVGVTHDTMMVYQRAVPMFCIPTSRSTGAGGESSMGMVAADAFLRYARNNLPRAKTTGFEYLIDALISEFPCPKFPGRVIRE